MDCNLKEKNLAICNCTYEPCPRKGICCECIAYHRSMNELPGCYFSKKAEATYPLYLSLYKKLQVSVI